MGAWRYLEAKLRELVAEGHPMEIRYVGRPERASPAEGYPAAHAAEQRRIISEALGINAVATPTTTSTGGEGQG
jgi:2-oxoglutarate dehydrogenase E1 component